MRRMVLLACAPASLAGCAGVIRGKMYAPPSAPLSRAALGADVQDIAVTSVAPKFARAFLPDPFGNRAAVARLDEPLFLIHGDKDAVISPWHVYELGKAANEAGKPGTAIVLTGEGHQPDAALLAGVLDAIAREKEAYAIAPAALPAGTRLLPFRAAGRL